MKISFAFPVVSRKGWLAWAGAAIVAWAPTGAARADLVLSDPGSAVYYTQAVSAQDDIHLDKSSSVVGDVYGNHSVFNDKESLVTGNVSAVVDVSERGSVTGVVVVGAPPLALPVLTSEPELRALAERVIEGNHTFVDERIDEVVLVTGKAGFAGSLSGRGTVIALQGVDVHDIAPGTGPGLLDPDCRLSLISPVAIRVGKHRAFRGALRSGQDLRVEEGASVEGVLVSDKKVHLAKEASVRFLLLDETPPLVSGFLPAADAWVTDRRPTIGADFDDDLSLAAPGSLTLTINGNVVVPDEATKDGFRWTPPVNLQPRPHEVVAVLRDNAGNPVEASWTFRIDTSQPTVRFSSPVGDVVSDRPVVPVLLNLYDSGSGLPADSLRVTVDGTAVPCQVTGATAACDSPSLATGAHQLFASLSDVAGNVGTASFDFDFALDLAAPVVEIRSPAAGTHVAATSVEVEVAAHDDVGLAALDLNGVALDPALQTQRATVALLEGSNSLSLRARDRFGRETVATVAVVSDTTAPEVRVVQPEAGATVNMDVAEVVLEVADDGAVAAVTVGAVAATGSGREFRAQVPLAPGANELTIQAIDRAGNAATASLPVTLFTLPEVRIEAPPDLAYIAATTVDVEGMVSDPSAVVSVNGVEAVVSGDRFVAAGVPLIEGGNLITATATAGDGHQGTATINVVRDTTPPRIELESPLPGAVLAEPQVTVRGLVNDIVAGTVNASEASVTVAGVPAMVANRSFVATGVALAPGQNEIQIEAVDASGNRSTYPLRVWLRQDLPSVRKISGDRQAGTVGGPLGQPLVVEVRDAAGLPLAAKTVLFKVRDGDGAFPDGSRRTAVESDAAGRASVGFTLGTRAGAGAQSVEALVVGFAGDGVFSFDVAAGEPAAIVVDAGDQQLGVTGQQLPRPLVATVIDAGANRLANLPVTLRRIGGDGRFPGGATEFAAVTDSDGRVIVPYVLGSAEGTGTDVVTAEVAGHPEAGRATFSASAWTAGDPAATAIHGVVLDNTNQPIPGVTIRLLEDSRTVVTDEQGRFRYAPAPVGTVKLYVDGSTADRPGAWPDLEFVMTTVAGRDNDLGMPIFLLPLDLANGAYVTETQGGVVTLPELPGFALEIAPGSATFPSGQKSGLVSVTAVHADKIPMVPNFGQQPQLIVTIQPAGTRFDPPARMTLPNVEGLAPGQVTEMYSFDHDLGHFVSIGPARVSEDGSVITSAAGVGVLKAGWHCGGNPSGSGTAHDCPECQKCENDDCVPDDAADPGGPCISVSLSSELDKATSLVQGALSKVPFVDKVSVEASASGESCPLCCKGSKMDHGELKGTGSVTASAEIEKTLSPISLPHIDVKKSFLGIEVEFEALLEIGPFVRLTPSLSADLSVTKDRCKGEDCATVRGCGAFTVTLGGKADAVIEADVDVGPWETPIDDVFFFARVEASASAPGVAYVRYASGAACEGPTGTDVRGCIADLTGDIIVQIEDVFETSWTWTFIEGTPGCECGS